MLYLFIYFYFISYFVNGSGLWLQVPSGPFIGSWIYNGKSDKGFCATRVEQISQMTSFKKHQFIHQCSLTNILYLLPKDLLTRIKICVCVYIYVRNYYTYICSVDHIQKMYCIQYNHTYTLSFCAVFPFQISLKRHCLTRGNAKRYLPKIQLLSA